MKKLVLTSVAFVAMGLLAAQQAKAVVVSTTLTIVPGTTLDIGLSALSGGATADVSLGASGTIDITADNVGLDALALSLDDVDIALTDGSLSLDLGVIGTVDADTFGLEVGGSSGALTPLGGNVFDAGGTTLALDGGFITYEGGGFLAGLLPPGTFDFDTDPIALEIGVGLASITLLEEAKDAFSNNVTLVIPVSIAQSVITDPVDVDASITSVILATGMKLTDNGGPVIPEPSSWLLIGLGLMSVVPMIRRRLRR